MPQQLQFMCKNLGDRFNSLWPTSNDTTWLHKTNIGLDSGLLPEGTKPLVITVYLNQC